MCSRAIRAAPTKTDIYIQRLLLRVIRALLHQASYWSLGVTTEMRWCCHLFATSWLQSQMLSLTKRSSFEGQPPASPSEQVWTGLGEGNAGTGTRPSPNRSYVPMNAETFTIVRDRDWDHLCRIFSTRSRKCEWVVKPKVWTDPYHIFHAPGLKWSENRCHVGFTFLFEVILWILHEVPVHIEARVVLLQPVQLQNTNTHMQGMTTVMTCLHERDCLPNTLCCDQEDPSYFIIINLTLGVNIKRH